MRKLCTLSKAKTLAISQLIRSFHVQALAKHSHNGVHDYQLQSNLHSLPTSTGVDTDQIDWESVLPVFDSEVTSISATF